MKQILVSLSSDTSHAMREFLIGILNYANARRRWNIKIIPDPYGNTASGMSPETIALAREKHVDGIITGVGIRTPGFDALVESGIPVVLNNFPPAWHPPANAPISVLRLDGISVGRLAADYFRAKGRFNSYCYIPEEHKCYWSTYRKRGFRLALAERGLSPTAVFNHRRQTLEAWLSALPKPAAILATDDTLALNVIDVCQNLKLSIPEQVSIVGVDNDEAFCKASRPQLSSISIDNRQYGKQAAALLDRLMRTRRPRAEWFSADLSVIERESTRTIPPAGHLIQKALAYINDNYGDGITPSDVAQHLGVSPELLRLRFRTVYGRSLRDVILDKRLDAVKRLLRQKSQTITQIAAKTGFSSECRLSHFFAQRLGLSPQAWRRQQLHPVAR